MNEESYITIVDRASSHKIDVLFQEEVQLDINVPLFYIKSGEEEVKHYVEKVCKPDIDNFVENKKDTTLKYIDKHTNDFAIKAIEICADEKIGVIANYVSEAENSAQLSSQRASDALNYATISAEQAEIVQNNNKQIEETINRLDIKKKITNCITEIPQDIKLELIDGRLTLKAGSKVYVPNGFEADGVTPKFDVFVVESDIVKDSAWGNLTNTMVIVVSLSTLSFVNYTLYSNVYSGDSQPTSPATNSLWYDTANNIMKLTTNGGDTWTQQSFCLPIALVHRTSGIADSIEQIFNGFGYVGSTIFALPGIKGLIPDGRNDDGSLKNIEFTSDIIRMQTFPSSWAFTNFPVVLLTNNFGVYEPNNFVYKELENLNWNNGDKVYVNGVKVVDISVTNGVVTSFTPQTTFQALDRNDSSWIAQQAMPSGKYIDLTLGASGSSYTAPANGWFFIDKQTASANQFIDMLNTTKKYNITMQPYVSGAIIRFIFPVQKGDVIRVSYTASGSTTSFKFYYAEGEN